MFRKRSPTAGNDPEPAPGAAGDDVVIVDQVLNPCLVSIHDRDGFAAEQVRGLRNKLMVMNPDGSPRTLVVTSAVNGEGKSVTTINLGVSFAELEGSKVLLVDADLRKPSLAACLGMEPARGLTELLSGRLDLQSAIRSTSVERLHLLDAGARPFNPSEVLSSRRLDDLFAHLKEEFGYVIIDTPPVIPVTDASVVAAKADGTLLVVRLEHSPRSLVQQAARTITELGGNLLGTFVTAVRGVDPSMDRRYTYPPKI